MQEMITFSPAETEALGEKIAKTLTGGEVIALFGGMGMGKTAFTRGLARGLGIQDGVSSPTFALVHEYHGRLDVYHFDMFRVTGWDDLYSTGFFDYLDNGGVLVIEWSENIEAALPQSSIRIEIQQGTRENERIFHIEGMKQ
nr:tRNA (adenosine(37)-N6)-threonylcarbamoyltransferase complex ATPase subunit type 1 TsaE [uncultured Caproiciproducens sp.]